MQDRSGAALEQIRVALEMLAHVLQSAGLSVAHGEEEVVAQEDEDLAELHHLALVDIARRLEDDEDQALVYVELGPLVGVDGVLDCQRVEDELALERIELPLSRLVEADPGELPRLPAGLVGVVQLHLTVAAAAILVDGAVDDHKPGLSRSLRASSSACARSVASPA